jgi:uncharacterized protein (TIGR02466 family)
MNRAARRQQERNKKKAVKKGGFQMEIEAIMPWADVLMRLTLPPNIIKGMLEITDQVLQDPDRKNWGDNLAGQIQDEPLIPHQMLQDYKIKDPGGNDSTIFSFLMNMTGEYVAHCMAQMATSNDFDFIKDESYMTQMKSAWIISQWEGEYNPIHIHTECQMSTVIYLKIPKFLPSVKEQSDDDGCIMFIGGAGGGSRLTRNLIKIKPKVGDFYIFPAHLQHTVYPFRTDGDFERRSVSFNADWIAKSEYDKQQQMQQQQQQPPPAPVTNAPETLRINTGDG